MVLYWLTLGVVLAIILALAGYLIAIAWALARARANVSKLADGLEAIAEHTDPLAEDLGVVGGAVRRLADGFGEVDRHLGEVSAALGG